jgi:outer membrane protein insertion porin family
MKKLLLIFMFSLVFAAAAVATDQDKVALIKVVGNKTVSQETVVSRIKVRVGQTYNENVVNEDVRNLYSSGFFEMVTAEKEKSDSGVTVIFKLKEKPVIKRLIFDGNKAASSKKITDEINMVVKEGGFIDENRLKDAAGKIKDLYVKRGYPRAKVEYKVTTIVEEGKVEVKFTIDEQKIEKVRDVIVRDNKFASNDKIRKIIKTKPAWLLNAGIYKEEILSEDEKTIVDYYKANGYSDVVVGVKGVYKKNGVYVEVDINEGPRYYVGDVKISGNDNIDVGELKKALSAKAGSVYSEQLAYDNDSRLREVCMEKGYIFCQITHAPHVNSETKKVDLAYHVVENNLAYVDKIRVENNYKTRDNVIRREMRIFPGERFDGKKVRRSKERLERLGYFDEVRFGTEAAGASDQVDLIADVKEAKTGTLSFGGGYSSIDKFTGFMELRQHNFDYKNLKTFTGGGQDVSVAVNAGSVSDEYSFSFTNPWIFDKPISFGLDAYKRDHDPDSLTGYDYKEGVTGGALRLGREFNEYFRVDGAYKYDSLRISDVADTASSQIKEEVGRTDLSSVQFGFSADSRDSLKSPHKGAFFSNMLQLTGYFLGADRTFLKDTSMASLYVPLMEKLTTEFRVRYGIANTFDKSEAIPLYERFFIGGASTVRGYRERRLGPIDSSSSDSVGGESMFVVNVETIYKLEDFISPVVFYDAGNSWANSGGLFSSRLYTSVGIGLRLNTPIGPISLDYGWPFQLEPGREKKTGRFHFNVSQGF